MDHDEYVEDDLGSSVSSYTDEVQLSRSMENEFMFRRGGNTPKMSHFFGRTNSVSSVPEEDEDAGNEADSDDSSSLSSEGGRRHSSGSSLVESLSTEEAEKLASCLDYILDIVGEAIPEIQVKETIIKCEFNTESALNTLLNSPMSGGSSEKPVKKSSKMKPKSTRSSPPPCENLERLGATAASSPPVPIVLTASKIEERPSANFQPKPQFSGGESEPIFTTPTTLRIKKATRLDIRSRSPSPTVSTPGSNVKMRKNKVEGSEEYKRIHADSTKDLINLVVVGHVDSGKSTLMGHLLVELGQVSSKMMHKYEQESRKLGKQSFAFAWVLDETSEERNRGITMDVGQNYFETSNKCVRLLDAPGHRDFIPNMISGAYQADVAVMVVNATRGEFEAGFDAGGQTREHAVLVRSLGVSQLIVAVNKLDTVDWCQERFNFIVEKLKQFLKSSVGFRDSDVSYIPVSGLTGENLTKTTGALTWYTKANGTLVDAIDSLKPPLRLFDKPFRMAASDVFKPSIGSGIAVAGRIESGFVMANDKVLVQPMNEVATVKNIESAEGVPLLDGVAFAGEHVSLVLTSIDAASVGAGSVIVDPAAPLPVTKLFRAKIVVFAVDVPITKGYTCILHHGSVQAAASVKKLLGLLDKATGEVAQNTKKPRLLTKGNNAVVEIATETPVCLDLYANSKELGRFMLRTGGKTIAAGMVADT